MSQKVQLQTLHTHNSQSCSHPASFLQPLIVLGLVMPFFKACPFARLALLQGLAFFKLTLLQSFAPCWSGPEVGVIVFKEVVPGEVGCSPWCLAPPAPHPIITPPLVTQPASPYPFPARLPPIGSLQVTATLHILPPPERGNL